MCYQNDKKETICEVYTEYSNPIDFKIGLTPHIDNPSNESEADYCRYPFGNQAQLIYLLKLQLCFRSW